MAKKKSETPMQVVAPENVSLRYPHTVKTMLDSNTLVRLRIAMAEEGLSIVEFIRGLVIEALDERDRRKQK